MATIQIKRGTRAQLNTAAAASELHVGELYLVTDEDVVAVGLSATTYQDVGPGGGGLSASANEFITGNWDFQGSVDVGVGVGNPLRIHNGGTQYVNLAHGSPTFVMSAQGSAATEMQITALNHTGSQLALASWSALSLSTINGDINLSATGGDVKVGANRVLTVADEGTGNGLDADTLDGQHASAFLKTEATVIDVGTSTGTTAISTAQSGTVYYARPGFASTRTFRLDAANVGTQIVVVMNATSKNSVTFSQGSGQTIISAEGSSPVINTNQTAATALCVATNVWLVTGDLAP